jgi:hypothetical protein
MKRRENSWDVMGDSINCRVSSIVYGQVNWIEWWGMAESILG